LSSNAPESSQSTAPKAGSPPDKATSDLALFIAERLDQKQADDIKILDVSGPLVIADYFIIATVQSTRQAQSLAKEVELEHKSMRGRRRRNGGADSPDSNWVLIDFGDIVVHLFLPEAREYYGLESLWADVPRLPFTATAPRVPLADEHTEVRQPTLDGFGAFLPSAMIEPEADEDLDGDAADDASDSTPDDADDS
jgi:ribosome-associated protein